MDKRIKDAISKGSLIGLVAFALSYAFAYLNFRPTALMSTVPLSSSITPGVGSGIVKFIEGIIPISAFPLMTLIYTLIAGIAIYGVGSFLHGKITPRAGKTPTTRLMLELLYGSLIVYAIVVYTSKQAWLQYGLLFGLAIYVAIVSVVVGKASKYFKWSL